MTGFFLCYVVFYFKTTLGQVIVMFFFFGNKRHKIRAWEYALFEGENDYLALPNIPLYEQLTEAQIQNDCRIIIDCAKSISSTADKKTAKQRRKLAKERYKHLVQLKPFADRNQRRLIKEAVSAYRRLNQPDTKP